MLYNISLWLILYLIVCTSYSLRLYCPSPSLSPLITTSLFSIYVSAPFFVILTSLLYFLDSTYKWCHIVFVFLCLTCSTQCNALQVHPCCCKWPDFFLFYGWVVFHCVCVYTYTQHTETPHLLYLFICWWTHRLSLLTDSSKVYRDHSIQVSASLTAYLRTTPSPFSTLSSSTLLITILHAVFFHSLFCFIVYLPQLEIRPRRQKDKFFALVFVFCVVHCWP